MTFETIDAVFREKVDFLLVLNAQTKYYYHPEDRMEKRSLTLNGINPTVIIHLIVSILVISSSYLSLRHFFVANFPASIYDGSFCDISAFFNCDSSAYSFIAKISGEFSPKLSYKQIRKSNEKIDFQKKNHRKIDLTLLPSELEPN